MSLDSGHDEHRRAHGLLGRLVTILRGGRRPDSGRISDLLMLWLLEALNALTPKTRAKVVVHSRPDLEDGAIAILQELASRGYRPIVLCEDSPDLGVAARLRLPSLTMVSKNSLRGKFHFLTAGAVITTHNPYRIHRHPPRQLVVNIWHGEPLAKPVGILSGELPVNCSYTTVLSKLGQTLRCVEFGLPVDRVLVTGAPRNDRLIGTERAAVRRAASIADPDQLLIWLPTFRVRAHELRRAGQTVEGTPFTGPVPLDSDELGLLERWLQKNGATLLVKPHPLAPPLPLRGFERIRTIDSHWLWSRDLTLYTLMQGVDCLITDVSSVWIDFLLTGRPMLFFFPDIQRYRETRGFNLEPYEEWIPGPLVTDGDGLMRELQLLADGQDRFLEPRWAMKARVHIHQDARSAARVLDGVGL